MVNNDIISWLENWYHSQCDGQWEHEYGVQIGTLDNPGWSLKVNLKGTPKEDATESRIKIDRDENNWIHCFVREMRFEGFGGPKNLNELLNIFKTWISREDNPTLDKLLQ